MEKPILIEDLKVCLYLMANKAKWKMFFSSKAWSKDGNHMNDKNIVCVRRLCSELLSQSHYFSINPRIIQAGDEL